jgi:hypothetical protein
MSSSQKVTVEDASPSPPLPSEPLPAASTSAPVDEPITSLGFDESEDEDDEWNPSSERLPGEEGKEKGKGKGKETQDAGRTGGDGEKAHSWQAVWSAEKNGALRHSGVCPAYLNTSLIAWYFWNTSTGEVTWSNPLDPGPSSASSAPPLPAGPPPSAAPSLPEPKFGQVPDVDPDLAHLLPPEQRFVTSTDPAGQKAMFNSRTGRFTAMDYRYSVDHLDEYNRAKRMNEHYFDVEAWERQKQEENAKRKRDEEAGIVSKKQITKRDMVSVRRLFLFKSMLVADVRRTGSGRRRLSERREVKRGCETDAVGYTW